jgi:hypothetical protein
LAHALRSQHAALFRYEPDGTAVLVAAHDESGVQPMSVGERFLLDGDNVATRCCARSDRPDRRRR